MINKALSTPGASAGADRVHLAGADSDRDGLQDFVGAVSYVGPRRLHRRADSDHHFSGDRIESRGLCAADAILLPCDFAPRRGWELDGAGRRGLAATAAIRLHHHDDARKPGGAAANQHEAPAGLFQYRAGWLRADGFRRAVQRRHPRDAILPVRLLCNGCGRVPGRHDRCQLDRARRYRRVPRAGMARRNRAGSRTDYLPLLTDWDSAD